MKITISNLSFLENYKSNSQKARVFSESWISSEMYCPCCLNTTLTSYKNNKEAIDFFCPSCDNVFQLKSSNKKFGKKLIDGEYNIMRNYLVFKKTPNFFLMYYSSTEWLIHDLIIIPKYFFSESLIEKRKPLSETARRKGWVGCNILLNNMPSDAKIPIILNNQIIKKDIVKAKWDRFSYLDSENNIQKGWTLDILKCIDLISSSKFNLKDIYSYEEYLKQTHPKNKYIKEKIRQQLQILRDKKIIKFFGNGNYEKV